MKSNSYIDPFFAEAVKDVLMEKDGRSVTVVSLAGQIGFKNTTSIYAWINGYCNIGRKTLRHLLKENTPAGELARNVEKHYQLLDARARSKNMADCRQVYRDFYSIRHCKINFLKKMSDSFIDSVCN